MRVAEQLRYLGRLSGMDAAASAAATDRWLERLGVADRGSSLVDELSLGNQQRVQLAAAVLHEPDVLVLDEPFSGLDPVGVDLMADALLEQVRRGAGVVFSSHQLELVEQLCDAVTIIEGGRVVADGRIAELRATRRRRLVRVELDGTTSDPSWARPVPGVRDVDADEGRLLVELADDADPQLLLDAARTAGSVTHFSVVVPTLAELFREVVGDVDQAVAPDPAPAPAPKEARA